MRREKEEEEESKNKRTMRVQWCGIIIPAVNGNEMIDGRG